MEEKTIYICSESFINGIHSMKYKLKQELSNKSEKMTNYTKNYNTLERKFYFLNFNEIFL